MSRRHPSIPGVLLACAVIASACERPQQDYRGAGHPVDTLPMSEVVAIYRATLAGAFRLDDPTLYVVVDPTLLSRSSGLAAGDTMPAELLAALRTAGLVKGTCRVPVRNNNLICRGERAGYAVRFSQPFKLAPDTMLVHLVVQQYSLPNGPVAERLRFEKAFQVARSGSAWRAVREGKLPQP